MHEVVPFVGALIPEPDISTDNAICVGSYSMRHAARRYGWNPGVFDLEPYGFEEQRRHWGDHLLNADASIVPFKEVSLGSGSHFIRPVDDTKSFAGRVFDVGEFAEWQEKVVALGPGADISLNADTLVQVSAPKEILQEVRCWIAEGEVVTASTYKRGAMVVYSDQVDDRFIDFATELVSPPRGWSPQKAFCLDVCEIPGGLKIVEINSINSAGFYAADMQKLVMALDGLRR